MLHICCAPDATIPWTELCKGFDVMGYFYGSNIHPSDEYDKRRNTVEELMNKVNGQCTYPVYSPDSWVLSVGEFADESEGGRRCALCFRLQLESTARAAIDCGCSHMCTTLTISPHKDVILINSIGNELSGKFSLIWAGRVWRKNNGFLNSVNMARSFGLYRQNYCGCKYSKDRD